MISLKEKLTWYSNLLLFSNDYAMLFYILLRPTLCKQNVHIFIAEINNDINICAF